VSSFLVSATCVSESIQLTLYVDHRSEGSLSFSPGFNRVIRATRIPPNRFNGLLLRGKSETVETVGNQKRSTITRLKPGENEREPLISMVKVFGDPHQIHFFSTSLPTGPPTRYRRWF
jgi:hypothetical protein